ncbi:probable protein phosphatase 2C 2 [Cryptomeria japonica]|uniref:probable protein phosphatase 2C 2 n=1 Tax=Cryptomeria japonica TaxID=3369 RepID=UPI0025AD8567|nr:probable protein phosphatase 2C 2 [Cryptomeria japonica]XP_057813870.1 probable protein phosphatase 2C 2 [Cryptomeria japonica]
MNLERLVRLFYRLFQGISMCFVFIRTCKTYSKLKMALSAAVEAASLSPVGVSTSYSPNSVRRRSFQDLSVEICSESSQPLASPLNSASPYGKLKTFSPGSKIRNSSVHFQECLGPANTIPIDQFQLVSPRRPNLTGLNQNCHGFVQGNDLSGPSAYFNTESSVKIHEDKVGCDDSKVNATGGFIEGNGLKLNRPPLASKRRRPPTLEIPHLPMSLTPCFHRANLAEELQKETCFQGCNYSVACKKGRREVMEDAYKAIINISGDSRKAFFGVFDGHGGRKAADFAAERLGQNIADAVTENGKGDCHMEDVVRTGYLTTDEAFSKQNINSGACCVTALITGDLMVVANAGDCRAVLSRDGNAEALTCDHRVEREDERQRIEDLGGYVDCHNGVWRVQGLLAVSRSIGDINMKELISAEPEMKKLTITPDCEFLILASDGLWDKISNQEAVDTSRALCVEKLRSAEGFCERSLRACRKLVDVAVSRGSKDDVTVMIVDLKHFCR